MNKDILLFSHDTNPLSSAGALSHRLGRGEMPGWLTCILWGMAGLFVAAALVGVVQKNKPKEATFF